MKVLVVDDSIVFRSAIVSAIGTEPNIEVVRSLSNGQLAVDYLKNNPDVNLITLDMEMPVLDGMATIKEIRKFNKTVIIIVFSSYTQKGAEKTIEALNAGANDFVTKPDNLGTNVEESINSIKAELLPKVMGFKNKSTPTAVNKVTVETTPKEEMYNISSQDPRPNIILIGCSTGGPEALSTVFRGITNEVNVPMLIVQHMPPLFTQKLAEMLNKISTVRVYEAKNGDVLKPGVCYIAPGDYHMTIDENKVIRLNQDEKVCFVRPSVDVMFNSVSKNFRGNILTFVLTGMGEDGAQGAKKLSDLGHKVIVQDKDSSVVWGMPGAVKKLLPSTKVSPLNDIGRIISTLGK
jgi:two-component system chemotaxis response regulator CheB